MKKTYLLFIILFVSIVAMGGNVTPDEARQKISKFMSSRRAGAAFQNQSTLRLVNTSHYRTRDEKMAPSYYVFNVGEGQGYVIAGADDRIPVVLGYSNMGKFDPDNIPVNMKSWLQSYSDQMAYLDQHPEAAAPRRTVEGEAIAPLLDNKYEKPIAWDQRSPYNDLCPLDGDGRSLTGCVATAMAQVMYFWKYPNYSVADIPSYTTERKKIEVSGIAKGARIDWDNMLPQYKGNETDAQKQAVANLMLLCGTSVQMDYTSDVSGAKSADVATALLTYFDYDATTTHEFHAYYRAAEWNQKVYDELKAGRPVFYDGSSSGSGHAFVVDGYSSDDYFHVNWGWGGSSNDYFLLSILDSNNNSGAGATNSSDGYSFDQGAIFGAQPNKNTPITDLVMTTDDYALPNGKTFTRTSVNDDFVIKVFFSYLNTYYVTYPFETGIGVFSSEGDYLGLVQGYWAEFKPLTGFFNPDATSLDIIIGKGAESGTFILVPMSRRKDTDKWYINRGADIYKIVGVIDGNTLTLYGATFGLTGTMSFEGNKLTDHAISAKSNITNNGTAYLGEIFLVVDGKMVGGRHFDIGANQTTTVDISFTPDTPGEKVVSLCTRSWNSEKREYEYIPFITSTVTVDETPVVKLSFTGVVENAEDYVVSDNIIKFKTTVTNSSANAYDHVISISLYKDGHDDYFYLSKKIIKDVQIASGESEDINVFFDNLENERYMLFVEYRKEGKWVEGYRSPVYTVEGNPDAIEFVKSLQGPVTVYGLNGNKVAEVSDRDARQVIQSLPKGVYIVRSGQQSKVIRR